MYPLLHHASSIPLPSPTPPGLGKYDLVLHCGACMIDHQKVRARLSDLKEAHVPVTNYGLLLAYAHHGEGALKRVLAPWGVKV